MNAPDPSNYFQDAAVAEEIGRTAALKKFELEELQNLFKEDLLLAQAIAGHGNMWGIWKTSKDICPSKLGGYHRSIDIAKRLRHCLAMTPLPQISPDLIDGFVEEGILVLTRLALLMRLAPTAGRGKSKNQRLKPSSIANKLYDDCSSIVARAILRKAIHPETRGLLSCLTNHDVQDLRKYRYLRTELERLGTLATRGCWADLPPQPDITQTTDPSGTQPKPVPQVV